MAATETALLDRAEALFRSEPAALAEATEIYRALREAGPVHEIGPRVVVVRYAEIKDVLLDNQHFSAKKHTGRESQEGRARLSDEHKAAYDEIHRFRLHFLSQQDGERHRRIRGVAHRAFTPRQIAELGESALRYLDDFLDPLREGDEYDLTEVAYQLPLMIICDLLGIPAEDRALVRSWSIPIGRERGSTWAEPLLEAQVALREFRAYVHGLLLDDARQRESELLATIAGAYRDGQLDDDEATALLVQLLFAGHETTSNLIGTGLSQLLLHREQWELLCGDPAGLAPAATEELLRWVSPSQYFNRRVVGATTIGDIAVRPDDTVVVVPASANRDDAVFVDAQRLDILRDDSSKHLAFSFSLHFCIGAALARLEAATTYRVLAERFPRMQLTTDGLEWVGNSGLRHVKSVPVRL